MPNEQKKNLPSTRLLRKESLVCVVCGLGMRDLGSLFAAHRSVRLRVREEQLSNGDSAFFAVDRYAPA